jgi:hypothetical protein
MEQHTSKNVNNCLISTFPLTETSGGSSSNLYLNVVHFVKTQVLIGHVCRLKAVVFLHWCLIRAVLLITWRSKLESLI